MTGPDPELPEQTGPPDLTEQVSLPDLPAEPPAGPPVPLTPADPIWADPVVPAEPDPLDPTEVIAAAVAAVPGVHDLHGGLLGEVATYLPRRRVRGVRLHPEGCEVHVTVDTTAPIATTVTRIREAVAPLVEGRVDIVVQDVAG